MLINVAMAIGIFAFCLGIGWLTHQMQEAKQTPSSSADPMHVLKDLDAQVLAELRGANVLLAQARQTIESGVR